ncbi:deoxyribose-phosphate aldolase [Antarcticibacterium flavum]|uniref:Deoxyribose-phosphate aldolase n=2 Tax=Flavobacteriaceae TaxID=49546 RepID=A0A5B7X8N7_9FLAO|nr:deoxyribose-phosphate aldolase [Antarcticibacterium sp. W02-3]QCY71440.1 deoxyribose-phosphate aldolase [Antarcticibacterium flavum]
MKNFCRKNKVLSVMLISALFLSCDTSEEKTEGEKIIEKSIEASGGENYGNAEIKFTFRNREYKSKRNGEKFRLERLVKDSTGNTTHDILSNEGLSRYKNGEVAIVPDSMVTRISDGVNSVHYFVQLPYVLNSPAANKELLGEDEVEGETYYEVKVTFREEGGGTDHHDEFVYWIHKENYTVGYLAYRFFTNNGGIRFRKAVNPRTIGNIRFVDYKNYKTDDLSTPLRDLDSLYEAGDLKFFSNIETENINVSINKNN